MGRLTNGERICRHRILNGWTQAELAKKIGVSQVMVSNWETGKSRIYPDERDKMFSLLGIGSSSQEADDEMLADDDGPSPFGVWLNKVRLERKMSVPELAVKADVSAPAIYNIEAGRITNPRNETVRKLEMALGEDVPAETKKESEKESTVKGVGQFFEFDPHSQNDWPDVPGIYVLYDISERPIYVGQGTSIKKRIRDHEEKFWFKAPIVTTAAYIRVDDDDLRVKVETILIRFLKRNAVINKQNVDR
jgi:transcriptional regulator with XRE-family HTH domain